MQSPSEHPWLRRLIGEWAGVSDASAEDGDCAPEWTETGHAIGGSWVVVEGAGKMPDGGATNTLMILGYDPAKGRIVGTWVGSMMSHMWIYEGTLDGDVLTLDTAGPDFENESATTKSQDIITFHGDDRRTLISRVQKPDGSWAQVVQAEYRRKA